MKLLDDLKSLTASWRDGLRRLADTRATLQAQIEALRAEEGQLLRLPAPKAEVVANIPRVVEALRNGWVAKHGAEVVAKLSGRIARDSGPESDRSVTPGLPEVLSGLVTVEGLAALVPDALTAGLTAVVMGTDYQAGAAMQIRLNRIREITEEIARIEREQTALSDAAAAAGIPGISLPDAERAARIKRGRVHEEWEKAEARAKALRTNHGYPHQPAPEPK